jgi:hypothetical protein
MEGASATFGESLLQAGAGYPLYPTTITSAFPLRSITATDAEDFYNG